MHITILTKMDLDFTRKPRAQHEVVNRYEDDDVIDEQEEQTQAKKQVDTTTFRHESTSTLYNACIRLSQVSILPIFNKLSYNDVYELLFQQDEMPLDQ